MSILVVAFDGLDHELIEEFELSHIPQQETGRLDNDTGIYKRKTSELFTSFITGQTYEIHGITDMGRWTDDRIQKAEETIQKLPLTNKFKGIRVAAYNSIWNSQKRYHNKNDYRTSTLFDKVENSRALNVPGYNPGVFWSKLNIGLQLRDHDTKHRSPGYYWDVYEHRRRRKQLFSQVSGYEDLVMAHFHRPDIHQHLYGDHDIHFDIERLEKLYRETDQLAADIKEYYSDQFSHIIFLSDHGLPTKDQHNQNAFYSSNKPLFPEKTPHITDFYRKTLETLEPRVAA